MTGDVKGNTYSATGQTFERTFEGLSKGAPGYKEALEALAKEYARINGLSNEQRQWLEDYLDKLDEIRDSWEKINDYVEDMTDNFDDFSKDLTDVRTTFTNIVKDLTTARQRGTETITLFRNFRDIAGDVERSLQVQNGFSEANLNSIQKRAQKAREIYEYNVKAITGGSLDAAVMGGRQAQAQQALEALRAEYNELETRRAKVEWWQAHRDEVRKLKGDIELLDSENLKNVQLTEQQATAHKKLGQEIRKNSKGLGLMAKFLEKAGVAGATEDYENYVQSQANAAQGRGPGMSKASVVAGWVTAANLATVAFGLAALAVKKIWTGLKDVSSELAKLQQNIGKFNYSVASANYQFASAKQYLETANELVQQFSMNPISFIGEKEIARLAEAKNLLGLSAEQAGNVGVRAKIAGQNLDQYTEAIVQGINHGNALTRSAVAHGAAMKEVLSTSDDIVLSLGNSGERLGQAIVAAKNLGMSLKDVDAIASQMLNFESSIENEMKAQLLTGNQLNLGRARALALQNDLKGLAEELTRQNVTAAKFASWNRIQQEATAAALGMSREQLGKMLVQQANLANLTDAQVQAATGMTKAQLEAMGISEKWKVAVDKLAQAFTPVLEAILPIVQVLSKAISLVAGFVGHPVVTWTLLGIGAVSVALRTLGVIGTGVFRGLIRGSGGFLARLKALRTGAAAAGAATAGAGATGAASTAAGAAGKSRGLSRLGGGIAGFYRQFMGNKVTTQMIAKGKSALMGLALGTLALPFIAVAGPLGYVAGPGLAALGKGISVLFKALGHIPPQALLTAGIALGIIGGFTVLLGGGIALAGLGMKLIGEGIGSISAGLKDITPDKVVALGGLSAAILSLSGVGILGSLGLLVLGLSLKPLTKQLTKMGAAAKNIGNLASNMRLLTASVSGLSSALNNFDDDKLETLSEVGGKVASAYNRSRATGTPETSIKSAATTAAEERMEKIVTGIANRLNSTLNVHVDNWDIDKISRQLAVETANDFR